MTDIILFDEYAILDAKGNILSIIWAYSEKTALIIFEEDIKKLNWKIYRSTIPFNMTGIVAKIYADVKEEGN